MDNRITALKVQKRNPNRVNVYLDGVFAFGLSRVVAAWLQVGQVLNDEKLTTLQKQDTDEVALQKALHILSYRPRSETEIQRKLEQKGFSGEVIEKALERLRQSGMVGDGQFARDWVENRSTFRPRGRRLLAVELRQKGVSEEVISDALQQAGSEEQLAEQVARRQVRRFSGLEWQDFRNRLGAYLSRKGFTYDIVAPLVKQLFLETQPDKLSIQSNGEDEGLEYG